jgi:hypothetical protein
LNFFSTYVVFLQHFTEHWSWCSWLHGLVLMVCPKFHNFDNHNFFLLCDHKIRINSLSKSSKATKIYV